MANDPRRLAGIVSLTIDGTSYMVAGDAKWQPSGVKRETLESQNAVVQGYSEKARAGSISLSLRDSADLSVASVQAIVDSTIVLELANGKTVVGRGMWNVEDQEVDTAEGKLDVKFEGPSVVEV